MNLLKPRRSSQAERASRPNSSLEYRSPALTRMVRGLSGSKSRAVLDLGAASGPNLEFYRSFSHKIHFADLAAVIAETALRPAPQAIVADLEMYAGTPRFDAVLCWDLFEYLEPPELKALGEALAGCCKEEAAIFALFSLRPEIPALPQRFTVGSDGRVRVQPRSNDLKPNPRYTKSVMLRLMPQFQRAHTYLLRRGVEEHIWFPRAIERIGALSA